MASQVNSIWRWISLCNVLYHPLPEGNLISYGQMSLLILEYFWWKDCCMKLRPKVHFRRTWIHPLSISARVQIIKWNNAWNYELWNHVKWVDENKLLTGSCHSAPHRLSKELPAALKKQSHNIHWKKKVIANPHSFLFLHQSYYVHTTQLEI